LIEVEQGTIEPTQDLQARKRGGRLGRLDLTVAVDDAVRREEAVPPVNPVRRLVDEVRGDEQQLRAVRMVELVVEPADHVGVLHRVLRH